MIQRKRNEDPALPAGDVSRCVRDGRGYISTLNREPSTILSAILCLALAAPVIAAPAKDESRPPRIARAHDAQKREYWGLTAGPQRKPAPEPPTVALTAAAADAALEEDWLYQAEGKPLAERSRQELDWTGDILSRLAARGLDVAAARATLDALRAEHPTVAATEDAQRAFYFKLRRFKRQLMFRHPEMDFDQLALADIPYTKGMEWAHETMYRSGALAAVPGGRLLKIKGLHPGAQPTKIAPAGEPAAFLNFDLSFDAAKVVYCMKPASHQAYHLYETDLATGATRQITDGLYDDLDPIYLPDGGFAFISNRANGYIYCGPWWMAGILTRCDRDGRNIYFLSHSNGEAEYSPALMPDGRILYTRWEYNDKYIQQIQALWTVNPDGTAQNTYWGNQSPWPSVLGEGRPVPGSAKVVFNSYGHHDVFSGSIGLVEHRRGLNSPHGLEKITAARQWADGGDGPTPAPTASPRYHTAGEFAAYKSPYPLSEDLYLVSMRTGMVKDSGDYHNSCDGGGQHMGFFDLYLMDIDGNRELIYRGAANVVYARPLRPRQSPPVIASNVKWPGKKEAGQPVAPAYFYSGNVREGLPEAVAKQVRYVRVLENIHRSYSVGIVHSGGGQFGSGDTSAWGKLENVPEFCRKKGNWTWRALPPDARSRRGYGNGLLNGGPATSLIATTSLKKNLGTVPVAADGSVFIEIPPAKSLYFQVLDSEQRALQTMRSWVSAMPGETRGCLGCHETSYRTPSTRYHYSQSVPSAIQQPAVKPTPPAYGVQSLSYLRDIQPIFDQNCVSCHQPGKEAGGKLDLTLRPFTPPPGSKPEDFHDGIYMFAEPYITLVGGKDNLAPMPYGLPAFRGAEQVKYTGCPPMWGTKYETMPPLSFLSPKSLLITKVLDGHHGRQLSAADREKLIVWVDTWAHFRGLEDIRAIDDPDPRWFTDYPNPPLMKSAPVVEMEYAQDDFRSQQDRVNRNPRPAP